MKRIERAWMEYRDSMLAGIAEEHIKEIRLAYYGAVLFVFELLVALASQEGELKDPELNILSEIASELEEFGRELSNERGQH